MTNNIYALLVGIDEYDLNSISPIPSLKGCVNDITAIKQYLNKRVKQEGYKLHLKTLKNQEATRTATIDAFQKHLCQAQSNDIVLFYFSGHGSQEQAPEEFVDIGLNRLNETLVCYDSRTAETWDLADKELAKLIAELSENQPHISIILDCCHSGSGTRDTLQETGVRLASIDKRKRPLNSFIFKLEELNTLSVSGDSKAYPSGWKIPRGRHVLLSACQATQKAKEIDRDDQTRGAFSYYLLDTLHQAKGNLTYRDLLGRAKALVSSQVIDQSPQLEVNSSNDENQFFLNSAIAERTPYFIVNHHKQYGWVIEGGAVHGIQLPSGEETTSLALFPLDSHTEDLRHSSKSIGTAKVTQVLSSESKIEISGIEDLATDQTLKAVITSLPLPPLGVYLEGDEEGINLARNAIQHRTPDNNSSIYVREEQNKDSKDIRYRLLCRNNQYVIARLQDDRPLVAQIDGYTLENAQTAIQRLEHIARWEVIAELGSSGNGLIKLDDVQMEFIFRNEKYNESFQQLKDIRVEYKETDGKIKDRGFQLKLTNKSNQTLYCALLDLGGLFDITNLTNDFFGAGIVKLEPNKTAWALNQNHIITEVPNKLWEQKITEYADIFKLIVSTSEFDASLLNQEELDVPCRRDIDRGLINKSTLNRLMNRIQDRVAKPERAELLEDWITKQVTISTVRPLATTQVSNRDSKDLGSGVRLQPHPSLNANARLTTEPQASRGLGNVILPSILREDSQITQTVQFTNSRGTDPGLSVLELTDVENPESVTKENPLRLLANISLEESEYLLPITYDGDFYLPLGVGKRTVEGRTEINLERLPNPYSTDRSVQGSIWMCFVKVVNEKLGRESKDYHLRAFKVAENQTVTLVEDIPAQVEKATNILLYVHGILGDTKDMVKSVQRAKVTIDGQQRSLNEYYDLILTFDYENINTSISEIARILKAELVKVGLIANHGKILQVVAHSMGGLVSRWFIEREGGNEIVQHLVMLGTPNAGSPWPTVQDLATLTLGIGLNSLSSVAWPVKILGCLVSAIEAVDVTLDQIKPNSDFLKDLAASPDPGIPYSVIAGNTSIIRAAMEQEGKQANKLKRLIQKLGTQVVEFPFLGQPNDIAVEVNSIKQIPEGRKILLNKEVACDHLTYFIDNSEALKALSEALSRIVEQDIDNKKKLSEQITSVQLNTNLKEEVISNNVTHNLESKVDNSSKSLLSSIMSLPKETLENHLPITSKSQYDFKRSFAIIIGIDYCDNEEVATLENAVKDAKKLKEILENPPYNYRILSLLEKNATKKKLNNLIKFFRHGRVPLDIKYLEEENSNYFNNINDDENYPTITKDDRILIYFAGHGKGKSIFDEAKKPPGLLIPQDSKNDKESLKTDELYEALITLESRHLLLILDCCYAGSFRWSIQKNRKAQAETKPNKQLYDSYIKYNAWQVITSASSDETASDGYGFSELVKRESTSQGHSPFAQSLFNALDPNGVSKNFETEFITATELYSFLRKELNSLVNQDKQKQQNPQIFLFPTKHDKGEYIFLELSQENRDKLEDAPALRAENNPYRGLESYEEEHSHLFFGRDSQKKSLYDKVIGNSLTLVTGYKGIGKSSLVKAGLIPYWENELKGKLKILDEYGNDLNKLWQKNFENSQLIEELRGKIAKLSQDCKLRFTESKKKLEEVNKAEKEFNDLQKSLELQSVQNQSQELHKSKNKLKDKLEDLKKQVNEDLEIAKKLWYIKLRIGTDPFEDLNIKLKNVLNFATHNQENTNWLRKVGNWLMGKSDTSTSNLDQQQIDFDKYLDAWKNLNSEIFGEQRLLIIDQFEELVVNITEDERNKFLFSLGEIVNKYGEWLRIVLTMPSDFKYEFQNSFIYEYFTDENQFLVEEMKPYQLRQAIEKPAQRQTMFFESHQEGEDLVNKLLDDVGQTPRLLSLVSYTLYKLYEKRVNQFEASERKIDLPDDRNFTLKDYEELGGVKESLVNQVNSVYEKLIEYESLNQIYQDFKNQYDFLEEIVILFLFCDISPTILPIEEEEQNRRSFGNFIPVIEEKNVIFKIYVCVWLPKLDQKREKLENLNRALKNTATLDKTVMNVMLRMVEVSLPTENTRRKVSISQLEYPEELENERVKIILKTFTEINILVIEGSSQDNHNSKYIGFVNDIVLKEWEKLKEWIAIEGENLNFRREIETTANYWKNKEKSEDLLWHNHYSLESLKKVYDSDNNWLNKLEKEFVECSIEKEKQIISEENRKQEEKIINEIKIKDLQKKIEFLEEENKNLKEKDIDKLDELKNKLEQSINIPTSTVKENLEEVENELEKLKADQESNNVYLLKKKYIISSAIISSVITIIAFWGYSRIFPNFDNNTSHLFSHPNNNRNRGKIVPLTEINRANIEISEGNKIITSTEPLAWVKLNGVQAFNDGNFEKAVTDLEKYLEKKPNDPEALIYLNNSKISKLKKKFYTIAVSAPIASDINGALEILRGVAQAQDEINKKEGINGIPLRVLIADDNDDKNTAKQIAEELVKNPDVLGVVGHFSSDVTLETGKIYNAGKLVAIFPISTSTKLTGFGNYIFRTVPNDSEAAKSLAGYMRSKLGKKNAAVFYNSKSASSESLKSEFEKYLSKEGGQVSSVFDLSDPNFNADNSIEQSIKSGAEVLVLLSNTGKLDDTLRVVKANNKRLPLLGGDDVYTPKVLEEGKDYAVGMVVAVPWHILASKTDFPKTSYDLWGASVNWRTAMSYNATVALIEGLKNTSTPPTREGLAQILRSPDFTAMGATGEVKFDAKGDRNQGIQLVEIQANPKSRSKSGYDFEPIP